MAGRSILFSANASLEFELKCSCWVGVRAQQTVHQVQIPTRETRDDLVVGETSNMSYKVMISFGAMFRSCKRLDTIAVVSWAWSWMEVWSIIGLLGLTEQACGERQGEWVDHITTYLR